MTYTYNICLLLMFVLAAMLYVTKMIESQNLRNARVLTFSRNKYSSKIIKLYTDTKIPQRPII